MSKVQHVQAVREVGLSFHLFHRGPLAAILCDDMVEERAEDLLRPARVRDGDVQCRTKVELLALAIGDGCEGILKINSATVLKSVVDK